MSRRTRSAPRSWRLVVSIALAAAGLAGCAATTTNAYVVTGQPSSSLDAPLQQVACTTAGSCLAVGVDDTGQAPASIAELRQADGHWTAAVVPNASSQTISSSACWASACLIGGSEATVDSLWTYNQLSHSVSISPAPHGGRGVSALSCFADGACAVVDSTGIAGDSRLSFSGDSGATWSVPVVLPWTTGDAVTTLSCTDALDCLVAATNDRSHVLLEVTHDGGLTWVSRTVPSTWTTLTSLTCLQLRCVALASTRSASLVVRTDTFFRVWRDVSLVGRARALACTTISRCVVVGQTTSSGSWLSTIKELRVKNVALKYVPSTLVDVACGAKVCAAIGDSTLLSLRP
jgi:hypothetical protein